MTLNDIRDLIKICEQRSESESEQKYTASVKRIIDSLVLKDITPERNQKIVALFNKLQTELESNPKRLGRVLQRCYSELIKICYADYKLVTKGYYRSLWLALGMSVIGVPLGAVMYLLSNEIIYISIFIPMGMVVGMGIGSSLDKKAEREERLLF